MLQYPPEIPGASVETYKHISNIDLKIWRFEPADHQLSQPSSEQRPAAVFFFGGGFRMGSPEQFIPQAKHLASRGMVSLLADYRVSERHQVRGYQCVEDAKAAMRWIRAKGNRCELVGYEGQEHGFFNYGRGDGTAYTDTVERMDRFLASLGWLNSERTQSQHAKIN